MMNRLATILLLAALFVGLSQAGPASARAAARRLPPFLPGTASILWVAAHPDDEVLLAPVLSRLCVDEGLHCSFLVLTRGEHGECLLPGGCKPDLATVRTAEMTRAARLYRAQLTLWSLEDGAGQADGSAPAWDASAGGHAALVSSLASFIAASGADLVLTFDPRHGTTCHADHRAVGGLVVESMAQVHPSPALYFLETRVDIGASPFSVRFSPAAPAAAGVFAFDATATWQTLLLDMQAHPSQFDAPWLRAVKNAPSQQKAVFLGHAALLLASPELVRTCQ